MIPHLAFSHAGINVADVDRMSAFYQRVLGLVVTDDDMLGDQRIVFLTRDSAEHHQLVLASGRPPELRFTTVNQLSFRVASLAELRAMIALLYAEGVSSVSQISHGTALSVYFLDPEGNRIELYIDTPWYIRQPMRYPIDLERSDDEIWRDAEAHARSQPGFRPAEAWRAELAARLRAGTSV